MDLAVLYSRALCGIEAPRVAVETHLSNGLPVFNIVGLADTEVRESRERVRAAILNCGFEFPARRITVNLAPADLPKASSRFDLAIALGILAASSQISAQSLAGFEFAAELSLSGELRPVQGALAMAMGASRAARAAGERPPAFIMAAENGPQAALVGDVEIWSAASLRAVGQHFQPPGSRGAEGADGSDADGGLRRVLPSGLVAAEAMPDLRDVRGQRQARRAIEIAAAGQHSALLVGPPGSGKSMLAQRLPGILPPLSHDEALETAAVQSLASGGFRPSRWAVRPFRSPHHTASAAALVGGGGNPRPGEISLAHHGVLFLDELPEFERRVLEVLREPLESGRITISRAARQADFPARFQFVAAMNPCPCGYLGHPTRHCRCTPDQVRRYQSRISGPLLDRIDLQVEVPAQTPEEMLEGPPGEPSDSVRERVLAARGRQSQRQGKPNASLEGGEIEAACPLAAPAQALLRETLGRLGWSARSYFRVVRVARTIADLEGCAELAAHHVSEAIQFRRALRAQ